MAGNGSFFRTLPEQGAIDTLLADFQAPGPGGAPPARVDRPVAGLTLREFLAQTNWQNVGLLKVGFAIKVASVPTFSSVLRPSAPTMVVGRETTVRQFLTTINWSNVSSAPPTGNGAEEGAPAQSLHQQRSVQHVMRKITW